MTRCVWRARWREAKSAEDKVEALKAELDEYASRADLEVLRAQVEVLVAREIASYRLQMLGGQFASSVALALLIVLRT